jgi:hypothetical protein
VCLFIVWAGFVTVSIYDKLELMALLDSYSGCVALEEIRIFQLYFLLPGPYTELSKYLDFDMMR